MKILVCTENLHNVNGFTLVPRYFAKELRALDVETKIISVGKKPENLLDGEDPNTFIFLNKFDVFLRRNKVKQIFDEFNPDYIHLNGFTALDSFGLNYAKKNKKFVLFTLHTRIVPIIKEIVPMSKFIPGPIFNIIQQVLIRDVKKVDLGIALTPEMKEYMYNMGFRNVEVIGNGVDITKFKVRQQMPQNKKDIDLLFVGNIEKRKNQIFLLNVMKNLPDNFKLHLVGGESWDKNYFKTFQKALEEYQATKKNVIYYGRVEPSKVNEIYDKCDIFISATTTEGLGNVFIEALVCGLPVVRLVGKNSQGVTENLFNAIHLPDDISAENYAKAVLTVSKNYDLYSEMYKNAIMQREFYSWSKNAKKLKNLLLFSSSFLS